MIVLGINAYHGDASAALFRDGQLLAAVEEERFTRVKHAAGFPSYAVRWCLESNGVDAAEIDHVAVARNAHQCVRQAYRRTICAEHPLNEIGPIVNTPEQTLDCCSRIGMDALVLVPYVVA